MRGVLDDDDFVANLTDAARRILRVNPVASLTIEARTTEGNLRIIKLPVQPYPTIRFVVAIHYLYRVTDQPYYRAIVPCPAGRPAVGVPLGIASPARAGWAIFPATLPFPREVPL